MEHFDVGCFESGPVTYQYLMWAVCINQLIFFFCTILVMSHECKELRLVPGTDYKAIHWVSHPQRCSSLFQVLGWASRKNVKHPGNPLRALHAQYKPAHKNCAFKRDYISLVMSEWINYYWENMQNQRWLVFKKCMLACPPRFEELQWNKVKSILCKPILLACV